MVEFKSDNIISLSLFIVLYFKLYNMNKELQRHRTVYTKDVLPKKMIANAKTEHLDMNEAVKKQVMVTRKCQDRLKEKLKELVSYIDNVITQKKFQQLEALDETFLLDVLSKIKLEEKRLRNDLLGQQESVEMLKKAVINKEVDDMYLDMEKEKRTYLTDCLHGIVEQREIVFSALEYIKRLNIVTNCSTCNGLMNLKLEYEDIESLWKSEDDKLKKFTEWQKNPGLMLRKQIKE